MHVEKTRKNALTAIIAFFITMATSLIMIIMIMSKAMALTRQYPDGNFPDEVIQEAALELMGIIAILGLIAFIAGIVFLIFYIISLINANKLKDRSPFVLLIVGLFVGIVGLVGLFMLRAKALEEKTPDKPSDDLFEYDI